MTSKIVLLMYGIDNFIRTKKPWKKDMNSIGILLSQLLTRNCNFMLDNEAKKSALSNLLTLLHVKFCLDIYKQISLSKDRTKEYPSEYELGVPDDILYPSG